MTDNLFVSDRLYFFDNIRITLLNIHALIASQHTLEIVYKRAYTFVN